MGRDVTLRWRVLAACLLVACLAFVPMVPAAGAAPEGHLALSQSSTAEVLLSCLADRGRIDVDITNGTTMALDYSITVGTVGARILTVAAGETGRETVTGRSEGPIVIAIGVVGGVPQTVEMVVDCVPDPVGASAIVTASCLAENGRIDVDVTHDGETDAPMTFAVEVTGLSPRSVVVAANQTARETVTGRPDGNYAVTVTTSSGVGVHAESVPIACDPVVTAAAIDIAHSCLASDGRVDIDVHAGTSAGVYVATFGSLAPRTLDLAAGESGRFTFTGRPEGVHDVTIGRPDGTVLTSQVPIACDVVVDEASVLTWLNAIRAASGAPPVVIEPAVRDVAIEWTYTMINAGHIFHDPCSSCVFDRLPDSVGAFGEVVAMGTTIDAMQTGLFNSAGHYAAMTEPSFTHAGIGLVLVDGWWWLTIDLVRYD